jgi:hypothetical protein
VRVEVIGDRARSEDQLTRLFADGWPAFIAADQEVKRHIGRVRDLFADLELVLIDAHDDLVAAGWSVPLRWNGDPDHLPRTRCGRRVAPAWLSRRRHQHLWAVHLDADRMCVDEG